MAPREDEAGEDMAAIFVWANDKSDASDKKLTTVVYNTNWKVPLGMFLEVEELSLALLASSCESCFTLKLKSCFSLQLVPHFIRNTLVLFNWMKNMFLIMRNTNSNIMEEMQKLKNRFVRDKKEKIN